MRRYQCAEDIGAWGQCLDMLTCASIFTNVALVGFTSDGVSYYIQSDSLYSPVASARLPSARYSGALDR
jgi:hypothetical protein